MKQLFVILVFASLLTACANDDNEDIIVNGVNVNTDVSTFNSFRTQGISGFPGVEDVTWNDILSQAAYDYAVAKTEDINTPANIYFLSNGQSILDFPPMLQFSGVANYALYYAFPETADVNEVINAGFASGDQLVLEGLMSANATQFGMGQYGGHWFLIMAE